MNEHIIPALALLVGYALVVFAFTLVHMSSCHSWTLAVKESAKFLNTLILFILVLCAGVLCVTFGVDHIINSHFLK